MRWKPVSHGARQGADRQGLGQAGHALEQDVAVGHQAQQQAFDHVALADDDLADLGVDAAQARAISSARTLSSECRSDMFTFPAGSAVVRGR